MVAGCGSKCIKLTLFTFTFLVWCGSLVLIALSGWMMHFANLYDVLFADDLLLIVTSLIMTVGVVLFVVGFSGCCGAMRESSCLLYMYFFFMAIIITLEIAAGVVSFTFIKQIASSMETGMTYVINNTYDGPHPADQLATEAVNTVQESFDCCGATGYENYAAAKYFNGTVAVPESCCTSSEDVTKCIMGNPGSPSNPQYVYKKGCVEASFDFIVMHFEILGSMCFVVLLFEGVSLFFSCSLISSIKRESKSI